MLKIGYEVVSPVGLDHDVINVGLNGPPDEVPKVSKHTSLVRLKALVWFWLIDETLSANLVYQDDYEIRSTTPSDEAMTKIITLVMIKCLNLKRRKRKTKGSRQRYKM